MKQHQIADLDALARAGMIHVEPPGLWGKHGLIVCRHRRLVKSLTDHVKPTLRTISQGRYVFRDNDGWLVRGEVIDVLRDGALVSLDTKKRKCPEGVDWITNPELTEWVDVKVLQRIKTRHVLASEQDWDSRPRIVDKLIGGRTIGLGLVPGTQAPTMFDDAARRFV